MSPSLTMMDTAFPTLVRYIGVLLMVGASVASGFGLYLEMTPVFVAASGAILFKNVAAAGKKEDS